MYVYMYLGLLAQQILTDVRSLDIISKNRTHPNLYNATHTSVSACVLPPMVFNVAIFRYLYRCELLLLA
jgi:hypothetical protein